MLAIVPVVAHSQADKKLIDKAHQGDIPSMIKLGDCYLNGAGVAHDSTLALKWFQKAADLGDGNAWTRVAVFYLTGGAGMTKDTARYFSIRRDWADHGYADAICGLGNAYRHGYGCKVDSAKAYDLWEQAAKKGSADAYMNLAYAYAAGDEDHGYKKDVKKALSYAEKAVKLGDPDGYYFLGNYYAAEGDYKKAWKYANEGIKWAEPYCSSLVATFYWFGHGVDMDEAKAQHILDSLIHEHHNLDHVQAQAGWFYYVTADNPQLRDSLKGIRIWQEGDALGMGSCQNELASVYVENGQYDLARAYYEKIASKDDDEGYQGDACNYLANMYFNGVGCDTNDGQALAWAKRGVEKFHHSGCAMAMANYYSKEANLDKPMTVKYLRLADKYGDTTALPVLGQLYAINGNNDQAIECFQQMIDRGNTDGYYWMAMLYDNMGEAKKCNDYLFQGDKKGNRECAASLGYIFENGIDGYKADYKKAAKYYERSGSDKSLYRIGIMYDEGQLGKRSEKDIAKSMEYIQRAADGGYIEAIYGLGFCYETGRNVERKDYAKALEYYQLLADNDVSAGQYKVATFYEAGKGGLPKDTAKAVEIYRTAAADDNALAICKLGDHYRLGRYLPHNCDSAFYCYKTVAEAGFDEGLYGVGTCYFDGCGVDMDSATAIFYLKSAAAQGNGDAAYLVARCYDFGKAGLTADGDSAIHYYLMGHNNGSGKASYIVGKLLYNEESYEQAVGYFAMGADREDPEAMLALAFCLKNGIGVKEADPKAAYRLFDTVAHTYRVPAAYTELGTCCLTGKGCPEDEALGKAYFDTAANLGHVTGMYDLGLCLLNGYGCRIDTAAAISWLEKAADNENLDAIIELGETYEAMGNYKNAVLYYEKAVAAGSAAGYVRLGHCYENGLGVVLNSQKAYELYMFVAEKNYIPGVRAVAGCYMNGIYVDESFAEGLSWMKRAADLGDPLAMYYCGVWLNEGGDGVAPNPKQAVKYLKQAAALGYEPAAAYLSRM